MRSRRPPRTSYGYQAPREAVVVGWRCRQGGCHRAGDATDGVPRWWPHPCPGCSHPVDAEFGEPWAHEARGALLRHHLRHGDEYERLSAENELPVWCYEDAARRDDAAGMQTAWLDMRRARARSGWTALVTHNFVTAALAHGDVERAIGEVLPWRPALALDDLEEDGMQRTELNTFVSAAIAVLRYPGAYEHPLRPQVRAAVRSLEHSPVEEWLNMSRSALLAADNDFAMYQAAQRLRAAAVANIIAWGLPPIAEAAAAVAQLETDGDGTALDGLVGRLGAMPSLRHLLIGRRAAAAGALLPAIEELHRAADAEDALAHRLRAPILATLGTLRALTDPAALDEAIAECRAARRAGRPGLRGSTVADSALARLLVWRGGDADVRQAVRLTRRRCRSWHEPGVADWVVRQEARAARGTLWRQRQGWLVALARPWSVIDRARLTGAWAAWAADTGNPELAAEAYQHLVRLVPFEVAAHTGPQARQRALAAAQEHTEEAGYWLARGHHYPEAVVALETGRAIGLTGLSEPGAVPEVTYDDVIAATGDGALVYVAAARAGGYALVVAARQDPQFVQLRRLDRGSVAELVRTMLPGHAADGGGRDLEPTAPGGDEPMAAGLKALFDGGVGRLIRDSARGRVVTFVPVGLLSLLPLHAAGEEGVPGDQFTEWRHAGHFSAVRYAPNARYLRRCQEAVRRPDGRPHGLLAVDVPDTTGAPPERHLAHVARETAAVRRCWTGPAEVRNGCTWPQFRAAADDATVWHLACHGRVDPHAILDSRLAFADREVTLAELRRELRPGRRRLAVLSACDTNLTDAALPNEVVGLPSALLEAGFAGVIASAWKVDDLATAYLMARFYAEWCGAGHEPPVALNHAQRWLRRATRDDLAAQLPGVVPARGEQYPYRSPRYWAAFAYTGA